MNTGIKITDAQGVLNFFDCIKLEHDSFNFTLPSWLDQKTFDEAMQVREMTFEYVCGGREKYNIFKKYNKKKFQLVSESLQVMK